MSRQATGFKIQDSRFKHLKPETRTGRWRVMAPVAFFSNGAAGRRQKRSSLWEWRKKTRRKKKTKKM
jgi:hypothetical protein